MNRIDQRFVELKAAGRKGLVGYLTAGDPTLDQSEAAIREALTAGVDVLELGVPFSDPTGVDLVVDLLLSLFGIAHPGRFNPIIG